MSGTFKSILIVEDDQDIRESLRDVLISEGYSILEAENGKVALDLISSGKAVEPCLILLDMMMPEMNGWEFLEARRKADAIATIPTIIVSAIADPKLGNGSTRVMRKPINLIELIRAIEGFCERHAA